MVDHQAEKLHLFLNQLVDTFSSLKYFLKNKSSPPSFERGRFENQLSICYECQQCQMASSFDSHRQLSLLLSAQTSFCSWLNLTIDVYKFLQCFNISVIKIRWDFSFKSFSHFYSLVN